MKNFGVSHVTYHDRDGNWVTIPHVALTFRDQGGGSIVFMQIVILTIVAVVFLVRLTMALYDRPSRSRNR